MEVFVRTVEAGSFAAAASSLRMTPQMVGRHVSAAEGRLGTRLLNRSTRQHSLTEAGALYLQGCRSALAAAEAAEERVAAHALEPRGVLRITAPLAFGSVRLVPDAARFLESYPRLSLDIELTDRRVNLVEEGYDAAIRIGALADSALTIRTLAPYRLVACASPTYLALRGTPTRPEDLQRHDCLQYRFHSHPAAPLWRFANKGAVTTMDPPARLLSNDVRALIEAALQGAGIVLAADRLLAQHLASGRLVRVLEAYEGGTRPMHLLFPGSRSMAPKLRSFIDWASAEYGRSHDGGKI